MKCITVHNMHNEKMDIIINELILRKLRNCLLHDAFHLFSIETIKLVYLYHAQ